MADAPSTGAPSAMPRADQVESTSASAASAAEAQAIAATRDAAPVTTSPRAASAAAEATPASAESSAANTASESQEVIASTTETPATKDAVAPPPVQGQLRDDRPRLRRVRAEDLEIPPEMQLRVHLPAPVTVAAPVVIAAETPAPQIVQVAETVQTITAALPVESEATADVDALNIGNIGSALGASTSGPVNTKVPRLVRTKMPEFLTNIPKPPPKPVVETPAPVAARPADDRPVRGPIGPQEVVIDRGAVDDGKGGRGRKLIYDRRRDSGSSVSDTGRTRGKKKGSKLGKMAPAPVAQAKQEKRHLRIEDTITVSNLAHQMSVKGTEVIRKLFDLGIMATVNHPLDLDTVELIAAEFGFTVENVGFDLESFLQKPEPEAEKLEPRSPVVTVMGHVDHGKTSLLDAIRKTHTANREAGGITQHIGAYVANVPGTSFADGRERRVVFLDTPGHEAFTAMRARGAKATDVIVLVVAADDGVMPQTIEAINHAKAAKVPMIVAVNKIDKPGADIDKVRRELADQGVVAEEWGGDTTFCEVSAKTGVGLDKLLEMLALQADIMELTANRTADSRGLVIESRLEKGRGPVATLLVQIGTLRKGQFIVAGSQYCKVRAMLDYALRPLEIAGPSTPVEVIGFDGTTSAGDEFYVVADEKKAKAIVEHRVEKLREKELLKTSKRTLEDMFAQAGEAQQKELNLIVKADVHGSAEALKAALAKIEHEEVKVRVLHAAVGGVTESDINLAATTKGVIIAFNVKPEAKGKRLADDLGVQIKQYSVIYDAIDDVTSLLEGMLTPIIEEIVLGHAEVRNLFNVPKLGTIAGCNVTDGLIQRSAKMRLFREKELVWEGDLASLRRFKDDVKEVAIGYDCGIGLQGFAKMLVGDRLECYDFKKTARKLGAAPSRPAAQ